MSHTTTRRLLLPLTLAAALALPLAGAQAAAASSPDRPPAAGAYAAQQESYLAQLQRAAVAGDPDGAGSGHAAQQRDYTQSLADAALRPDAAVTGGGSGDSGDGVPLPVAALLAVGGVALGTGGAVLSRRRSVQYLGPLPARSRASVA